MGFPHSFSPSQYLLFIFGEFMEEERQFNYDIFDNESQLERWLQHLSRSKMISTHTSKNVCQYSIEGIEKNIDKIHLILDMIHKCRRRTFYMANLWNTWYAESVRNQHTHNERHGAKYTKILILLCEMGLIEVVSRSLKRGCRYRRLYELSDTEMIKANFIKLARKHYDDGIA